MLHLAYKKFIQFLLLSFSLMMLQACVLEDDEADEAPAYSVEYASDMSMISTGKSTFTLEVSDVNTGAPVSGLTVSVMPVMDMAAGHMHDAPVGAVVDNGDGSYEATVYYLMPSKMMDGTVMGDWELRVMIGDETTTFYPDVKMAMGDTALAKLKGQDDLIAGMPDPLKRTYFIFKNSLTGMTDNHSFSFFIAARESMMSHVAVYENVTLNPGETYELLVSPITVEVSTDGTSWVAATSSDDGNYMISGLTGLTDNQEGEIYVRLSIQGEQKTTNGLAEAGDGTNDYATFTVTPGMSMSM